MVTQTVYQFAGQHMMEGARRRPEGRRVKQRRARGGAAGNAWWSLRMLALALPCALALLSLAPNRAAASGPAQPAGAPAYGADDAYVLLHVCTGGGCAGAADWAPYEQQLQALFRAGNWGKDPAVVAHSDPHAVPWVRWAADHVYYVDESTPHARRMALERIRRDRPGSGTLHIFRVPTLR